LPGADTARAEHGVDRIALGPQIVTDLECGAFTVRGEPSLAVFAARPGVFGFAWRSTSRVRRWSILQPRVPLGPPDLPLARFNSKERSRSSWVIVAAVRTLLLPSSWLMCPAPARVRRVAPRRCGVTQPTHCALLLHLRAPNH
jgi:hypothetical protein